MVATCPKAMEGLLASELADLGCSEVSETAAAVTFEGTLETAYRVCLWSRLASRVLLPLAEFPAANADELYEGVHGIPWEEHVDPARTLAVRAVGTTDALSHTGFTARRVKDGIVDRVRSRKGSRPSVDLERPDVTVNLRLRNDRATVSIDLSGEPLHRRGYRTPGVQAVAPLKENLAAAILLRAGWPARSGPDGSDPHGPLLDPVCGSGTLLVEGALMAADRAPGLLRRRWGFEGWSRHDPDAWSALLDEADARAEDAPDPPPILGRDADPAALGIARDCVREAGLSGLVSLAQGALEDLDAPPGEPGLLVANPPHGGRLGDVDSLVGLYETLGARLRERFDGWQAAVFTPEPDLARALGLRARKRYRLYNGAVRTGLYLYDIGKH
jgi:23S rRNA (guanine2445-N2)-methyltransferase / 23S rRNA (guanine2069-N7)-methyltransferase